MFGFVMTLAAVVLGLLCLSGCAAPGLAQAAATAGGKLTVERKYSPAESSPPARKMESATALPSETLQFAQGDNAKTPSMIETSPDGRMKVVFGTVEKPVLAIPPAPDYTTYWCLAAGIVFIGGGIALACSGWPQIGGRLTLAGTAMVVLALTIKSYGWAYVTAVAVAAGYVIWEKFHAYKIGVAQANAAPKQA